MTYDLVVIGTGPGGYVCAIRAAQLGLKTAVVEKAPTFGGTCLNVGCIPSKALLHASHKFAETAHGLAPLGVVVDAPRLDLATMMKHKDDTVAANVNGVAYLLKKNKVDAFHGVGRVMGAGLVEVIAADGATQRLETKNICIATGSTVAPLRDAAGQPIATDEKIVLSSTGALALEKVPERLVIVGAGVIGLELGSVWRRLGAKVTVIEFLDRILPGFDAEIATRFKKILEKQGFAFHLASKVTHIARGVSGALVSVAAVDGQALGSSASEIDADAVLIATGRIPFTEGLGLGEAGVAMERGRIVIDEHFRTNIAGVFAIGDVVRGPMLAHKAEDEGVALAESLAGQAGHVNYGVIPGVVYTMPEVAAVGLNEEEAKAKGLSVNLGAFPFSANGRARAMRETDGLVKIIADAATDRVLGVHILGAGAGEMIAEAAVLMEFSGSAEDLARTCHAHPTLSEAMKEAALAVAKRAIHI
jgi:dihydrolipoamide dehydrogenase